MLFIVSPNKWIDNFKTVFHSICNRLPYLLFIANPIPPMFYGSSSTLRWQHFAIGLARSCHNGGKVVPSRWQSCAKPKKKFGTREVLLTGVNRRKSYIKQKPCKFLARLLRKLGDSNPRYGYPYVSLANWWFQPLTQTSLIVLILHFL